ncbi:peptidase dimerization domain-containing protein [Amycolatopsis sp. cg5]|uniref:peptidase dimerization domain-containing protein n=1 Tax=Amycolatopsis sp. cg5 TaxID=3238802 RepID=UPI00352381FE
MEDEELYDLVDDQLASIEERLWNIGLTLHADPEPELATRLLTKELELGGFKVERDGLAFTAVAGTDQKPCVALLVEYDAVPGLGHALGHNLVAIAGLGAALSVVGALGEVPGTLRVIGTPAEGKEAAVRAGWFDGLDAVLMFQPGVHTWMWAPLSAQVELEVAFHGRAAHVTGDPADGVDALAALIQLFTALAALHRRLPRAASVQGIITHGGDATDVVPDLAQARFGVRAPTARALDQLVDDVTACAEGAASASGATVEVERLGAGHRHFRANEVLAARFARHLAELGVHASEPDPVAVAESSDVGNVSTVVPTICPLVAIADPSQGRRTPAFTAAAAGARARSATVATAGALARTAVDLLRHASLVTETWACFQERELAERSA